MPICTCWYWGNRLINTTYDPLGEFIGGVPVEWHEDDCGTYIQYNQWGNHDHTYMTIHGSHLLNLYLQMMIPYKRFNHDHR